MNEQRFSIRRATLADAPIIAAHRRAMFEDMQHGTPAELDAMQVRFVPWVTERLARGEVLGWLGTNEQGAVITSAGLWLFEWIPSAMQRGERRGYIFNVYTHPDYRRRGCARQLMTTILSYCRQQGLGIVGLHASADGRALYESLGFKPTNEMRLILAEDNG